jgi:hypothetical protein
MKAQPVQAVKETKKFMDNTYSLAKALHFINLAKQYLEDVQLGTSGEIKLIFKQYIQKCDWILFDLKNRLSIENREVLAKELEGSLDMNAVMDKVVHLNNDQVLFIETVIDAMIKGEDLNVEFKNEEKCQE